MRTTGFCALFVAIVCLTARAQQGDAPPQPSFRTGVSLVEVTAVVVGSDGRSADDLTADDFTVLEDGVPRPLASVRRLTTAGRRTTPAPPIEGAHVETLATNVGQADAPAFVLVLDDLNTSPYDAHRVIRAGLGVLDAIPPEGLVGVVTTSGVGGRLLTLSSPGPEHEAFVRTFRGRMLLTGPKAAPMARMFAYSAGPQIGSTADTPCGSVAYGEAQSQDCGDPTRAARRAQVVEAVAGLLGRAGSRRKVVFWLTEDMGVSPLDPQGNQAAQLAALRGVLDADVAVYPVNPREGQADMRSTAALQEGDRGENRPDRRTGGVVRVGPGDGALSGSSGAGQSLELNTDDMAGVTLGEIARLSGGRWIHDANDLETVLGDVVVQNTTSYVLAFEAAQAHTPGRHVIDVRVRRDGARVFARRAYVVPAVDATAASGSPAISNDTALLLRKVAAGTVSQGQLAMRVQVVPEFAKGRTSRVLVNVELNPASVAGTSVDLVLFTVDDSGGQGTPQAFRIAPAAPGSPERAAVTTLLPISRGAHQVRVAAVTGDGKRAGLVIVPVEVVEPRNTLLMSSPVLLTTGDDGIVMPTLARTFNVGSSIGLHVDLAGRPVRDGRVTTAVTLVDTEGTTAREAQVVLDADTHPDRTRMTASLATAGIRPGDYMLLVEAHDASASAPLRRAVAVTLHDSHPSGARSSMETGAPPNGTPPLQPLTVAYGPETRHPRTDALVIRDATAWAEFWQYLPTRRPPPDVDFGRVTLLAFVLDGDAADRVLAQVERLDFDDETLVVHWGAKPAPSAPRPTAGDAARPFTVVGISRHDGPVRFLRTDR